MSQHPVIAWWLRYNPLTQKPKTLEPFKLWHWYSYYGPDPSAGVSYGHFVDDDSGTIVLSEARKVVYSPTTGKAMKMVEEIPHEELEKALSEAKSHCESMSVSCTACTATHRVMGTEHPVYCVSCGSKDIKVGTGETAATKGKIMTKDEKVKALKDRIKAKVALAKKNKELEDKAYAKILARKRALAEEKGEGEGEEDGDTDDGYVALDDIVDEVNKAKKESDGDMLESFSPKIGGGGGGKSTPPPKPAGGATVKSHETGEEHDEAEEHEPEEEGGEGHDEAEEHGKGDGEEFMDLDMVLSIAQKKEAIRNLKRARIKAKIRKASAARRAAATVATAGDKDAQLKARIRAKIKAHRKAAGIDLGSIGQPNEVGIKEESSKPAEESPMPTATPKSPKAEQPSAAPNALPTEIHVGGPGAEAAPAADGAPEKGEKGDKGKDEGKGKEDKAEKGEKEEKAEAVKFEPLASLDAVKATKKEDVDMALFNEGGENPTWNITVGSVPCCRIELKDQPAAEEIRKVFCSNEYAMELMEHCDKAGFVETMQKVNARFWVNEYSNSKALAKIRGDVDAMAQSERKKYLASYQSDFLSCLNVVTSGLNKNFYPEGNPLKEQLFSAMITSGMPEDTAKSVIESSFAGAGAQYFKTLFEKSTEYLNMAPETRREIAKAITNSPVLNHTDLDHVQPATLADRVAQASIPAQLAPTSPLTVRSSVNMDSDSYKADLRGAWRRSRK